MALDYTLTLSGTVPNKDILERAFPGPAARPGVQYSGPNWIANGTWERLGFDLRWGHGTDDYLEAEADGQMWTWELKASTRVNFRLNKSFERATALRNLQTLVSQLLASGNEDMVLVFNGDYLLIRRMKGALRLFGAAKQWKAVFPSSVE